MKRKIAVVLLNLGGPTSSSSVKPFLYNLFLDEDIIKVPFRGVFRRWFAGLVSTLRAKPVAKKYHEISICKERCLGSAGCPEHNSDKISCCSPINSLTEKQRAALETLLNHSANQSTHIVVKVAMRYWHPLTQKVQQEILNEQVTEIILVPLYPHFSVTTTGSSLHEWRKQATKNSVHQIPTNWVSSYHVNSDYLAAINERIDEGLQRFPEPIRKQVIVVFSAHGTPISEKLAGDPYSMQIQETVQAVIKLRQDKYTYWLGWQSRVGTAKWLQPNTLDLLHNLIAKWGAYYVLVVPVAFVTDHIETLHEIGIEFREQALHWGCKQFEFTAGINEHPKFIQALASEIQKFI